MKLGHLKNSQLPKEGELLRTWQVDGDIIYAEYLEDIDIEPEAQDRQLQKTLDDYGIEALYGINDFSNLTYLSRKARNWADTDFAVERIKAYAIIAKNPMSRILANFFIGLNKTRIEVKVFSEFTKAYEWIVEKREERKEST